MANKQVSFDLYKTGVIADLSFSHWGAKTELKKEDLGLKDVPKEFIQLGGKRLVPKDKMAKINSVVTEARGYLDKNSFPFPFGAVKFIPYARLQKVLEKLGNCQKQFNESVDELLKEYPEIRAKMLKEYDKIFQKFLEERNGMTKEAVSFEKKKLLETLEEKYPEPADLRKKFGFEFVLFEIKEPDFESVSSDQALSNAKIASELEASYKKMVEKKLDTFLEGVIAQLKAMVLDIVSKLKYRIEHETISMASVKSFKKFAESFRGLDFVDTNIDQAISQLEEKLGKVEKSDLDDVQFVEKLSADLDGIKELAVSLDMSKVLGKFKRKIRTEV